MTWPDNLQCFYFLPINSKLDFWPDFKNFGGKTFNWIHYRNLPSTNEVNNVTLAAFLLPAGSAIPILSNLSLKFRPPSLDLALKYKNVYFISKDYIPDRYTKLDILTPRLTLLAYRLRTPPSSDAFKHSGGASLLWTSATVTLYFDVELNRDKRPGTEQNTSAGVVTIAKPSLLLISRARIPVNI